MKIRLMGAARTVTGSCFMVETNSGRFAIDCGMHQGGPEIEKRNWDVDVYRPENIDFFIITHAHIDHSGLLPRLVSRGFRGPVYTTAPTQDLLKIMLLDSAYIQEMEAQWRSKKRLRHGEAAVKPLYTQKDAQATFPLLKRATYNEPFTPLPGISVTLRDAGHILGAAMVELTVEEAGGRTKVVFSGDLGRPAQLLVNDPSLVDGADHLFLESTYGERNHKNENDSLNELAEAINYSYGKGEKVIIPAFAVARTQELIYTLYLLSKKGKLPSDMPVYVDSPLAIKATEVFKKYHEYFDRETRAILQNGENPLDFRQLRFTETTEESMRINNTKGPAIVISASGMANAGRIKHHLRHNIWRPGASIVFVGFQASGTPGRKIVDGAKRINILGEDLSVAARVFTINGFSGHAGQKQLLDWLDHFRAPQMQVFLFHGEYLGQQVLAQLIREKFGWPVHIPDYLDEIDLRAGAISFAKPEAAPLRPVDWGYLLAELAAKTEKLNERRTALEAKGRQEQLDIRDRILELDRKLMEAISEL